MRVIHENKTALFSVFRSDKLTSIIKKVLFPFFLLGWLSYSFAQDQSVADSLKPKYERLKFEDHNLSNLKAGDTTLLKSLVDISYNEIANQESGLKYAEELIKLSQFAENKRYLGSGYFLVGQKQGALGRLDEAMKAYLESAELASKLRNFKAEGDGYGAIADVYSMQNNHDNAKLYYNKAINVLRQSQDSISLASALYNAGDDLRKTGEYDLALSYFSEAGLIFNKKRDSTYKGYILGGVGMVQAKMGKNDLAFKNLTEAIKIQEELHNDYPECDFLNSLADVYLIYGNKQAALKCLLKSFRLGEKNKRSEQIADASFKLSELYDSLKQPTNALKYYKLHIKYRDSVNNIGTERRIANLRYDNDMKQRKDEFDRQNLVKQIEVDKEKAKRESIKNLAISLGIILSLTIGIIVTLLMNNRSKQKAYKILNLQKQETDRQRTKAENTLSKLQLTQRQLIQSAKMASLGELTAGIAHEIQNPLNFVNNFSEVSGELLSELKENMENKLNTADKEKAHDIINDIASNLQKISHHGKRADSIVKGMLQHSRMSANKREFTDINALADEYLRLSYHGLRAKDNTFKIILNTDFDYTIGALSLVPQDIGRVLLNIFNNAFYSVQQKTKLKLNDYDPQLWLSTKRIDKDGGSSVQIRIRDNGVGIPDEILNKIFNPFFTTKPSGQGTGLGLSLSYDIITNEHNGQLSVETKEDEFAEFIIELPIIQKEVEAV